MAKKTNMYEWITGSFNPIGGECPHMCRYCYVKNFRFPSLKEKYFGPPRLYENELKRNLGKDKFWFVGSCFDIFADEIPTEWIDAVLLHCNDFKNRYLFQSKNPRRFCEMQRHFPPDVVLGTTIESDIKHREMGCAPRPVERAMALRDLRVDGFETTLTIEPIMDFNIEPLFHLIDICRPVWVNIGANTNHKVKLPEPPSDKIKELVKHLEKITEVKIKPNLKRLWNQK